MSDIEARENDALLHQTQAEHDHSGHHLIDTRTWLDPTKQHRPNYMQTSRTKVRQFLSSKTGHYMVLGLVVLDVAGIFADFVINLFKCERQWGDKGWDEALEALSIIGLVFSSLFMLELIASIWAWGLEFFHSWFHCFDAIVITAAFALDVALRGVDEEAASLIVVLRLWRVFKIIEELSVGAQEQVEELQDRIEDLEKGNKELRDKIIRLESNGT